MVQKKQVHFENNHWTKKRQNTRRETDFKNKKIKLLEFYLQIKPPRNKKKTQVVKCRQEKHAAIGGDGRRKGKKREQQQRQQYKAMYPNSPKAQV